MNRRTSVKICWKHGETKFSERGKSPDLYWKCCKCEYESIKRSRRAVKEKLISHFGGKCIKCGYNRSIRALSFHHRDPSIKLFELSADGYKFADRLLEAQKCDLLCANCHAEAEDIIHIDESCSLKKYKSAKGTHGTRSAYRYCKCNLCKAANTAYMIKFRGLIAQ